jgi:hypothetical protein
MNYAISNNGLKYNYLLKYFYIVYRLFCTKLKHLQYENGQFPFDPIV